MTGIKYFITTCSILIFQFLTPPTNNAEDWKLTKFQDGIKVYTRYTSDSNIKEIRVTTSIKTTTQQLMKYLGNVPEYTTWVYKCNESKRLQTVSSNEFYYYTNTNFPFPLTDRDLVVHSTQRIDAKTGTIYSKSVASPNHYPLKKIRFALPNLNPTGLSLLNPTVKFPSIIQL